MSKLKDEIAKLAVIDFFRLAKREPHPRKRIRLLALGHLGSGKTKTEVTVMFKVSFPTLRLWLTRFIDEGIEGLNERARRGRKKKLETEREEEFCQRIEQLQLQRNGGRIRGQDVQALLKEKFCADYALPSVYHVLERCGLSWVSARSKHPKSDPLAQEEFKKNFKKK